MARAAGKAAAGPVAVPDAVENTEVLPGEQNEADQQAIVNRAYAAATKQLREENRARFIQLQIAFCKEEGLEWKPRPTKAERAKAELEKIYAEFPDLRPGAGVDEVDPTQG